MTVAVAARDADAIPEESVGDSSPVEVGAVAVCAAVVGVCVPAGTGVEELAVGEPFEPTQAAAAIEINSRVATRFALATSR